MLKGTTQTKREPRRLRTARTQLHDVNVNFLECDGHWLF